MSERVEVGYRICERQGPEVWRGWHPDDTKAREYAALWDKQWPQYAPHTVTRITRTTTITETEEPINV